MVISATSEPPRGWLGPRMFFLLFILFPIPSSARVECYYIIGRLRCPTDHSKIAGVQIDLMDEDPLPLEQDDTLGRTWSAANGSFTVSGCGSDFGPLNTPDGYLRIFHSCPPRTGGPSSGELQLDMLPIYLPHVMKLGSIYLDRNIND